MRPQRQGATLIEVLVAIFVMAIGLIALLALFPLGALRMAQAIQDDQCALISSNAAATINARGLRFDPEILQTRDGFGNPIPNDPYANPLPTAPFNGSRLVNPSDPTQGSVPLDNNGPSFPVLVDPNGYMSALAASRHWAPTNIPGVLSRRTITFPLGGTKTERAQWFDLLDDITFDRDVAAPYQMGRPSLLGPSTIERDHRLTWAYLLQKPRLSEPAVIDCSVIVYKGRVPGVNEYVYDANPYGFLVTNTQFSTTTNSVIIDYSNSQPPPLRVGSWLLDVSYGPGWAAGSPAPHGYWYRVVSVNDNLGAQSMEVEVQQTLRGFPPNSLSPGTVLVLEGVVEVYERGAGR